jgi:hypothetical protein
VPAPGDPAAAAYPGSGAASSSGAGTGAPGGRCDRAGDPGCPNAGALRMDPNVWSGQRDPNVWAPTPPPAAGSGTGASR